MNQQRQLSWRSAVMSACLTVAVAVFAAAAEGPTSTQSESIAELSVPPTSAPRFPDDRPEWIDAAPDLESNIHWWSVVSPPSSTPELSRRALKEQLRAAAETYVETLLDLPEASDVIDLPEEWIAARIDPKRRYEGEVFIAEDVFYESAAELRFLPEDQQWIRRRYQSHRAKERMVKAGVLLFGSTLMLALGGGGLSVLARRCETRRRDTDRCPH